MLGVLVPGGRVPLHYHRKRESIIIYISGEGTEFTERGEFAVKAGDVLFIPAGEKHGTVNRTDRDLRYLEFFTNPPLGADFIEAGE